jgi:GrpB-like predicted nucleotidyltransferase (UPF0157 family)/GNAT superfamily N-acetyltransferase
MAKEIEVVPYNPEWPKLFEFEASRIKDALADQCIAIYHVGSTSVPRLAAKPKIDIIAVVKNPEAAIAKLKDIGFDYRGEYNIPMHYGFSKRGKVSVNLHVYEEGNPEIELNLTFRDYLRNHPEVRDEYAALKLGLLEKEASFEKKDSIFTGYNLGKDAFIRSVLKRAGFDRLRFVICTHFDEWLAAKAFRQRFFSDKDPYEWTFNHPDHLHLILYKGVEIIGYAHVQLWPKSQAAIRIIIIEEAFRNQGYGTLFLKSIESWLKSKGCQSIHTQGSPDALSFYEGLGYTKMPFNDPDQHKEDPHDTPIGKFLK